MSLFTDREYLLADQYKNASNLDARIQLHRRFSTNPYGWMAWCFEHLDLGAEARILDLGCGPGDLWEDNGARIPTGWEITLADFSAGMIHQARAKLGQRFAYAVGDAQAIPFKGESFDAVIANYMLYHVPDRPRALAEIRRVLKPGGRLYAATNGRDHMRELREMIAAIDPEAEMAAAGSEFGLENGREQLARVFAEVTLHRYEDGLLVTEVEPLVAYVLSSRRSALIEKDPRPLTRLVERKMASEGAIHITKASGLFEARK
jgi:SAM-dependent methyltransferase